MHRKSILVIVLLLVIALLAGSCKKGSPVVFSWDYQGFHYVADSASVSDSSDNRIVAYSGYRALGIEGGTKLKVGSYTLGGTNTPAYLFYYDVGITYSTSGTVTITANDNTKISGSFSSTLSDGTYISGSFDGLPYK